MHCEQTSPRNDGRLHGPSSRYPQSFMHNVLDLSHNLILKSRTRNDLQIDTLADQLLSKAISGHIFNRPEIQSGGTGRDRRGNKADGSDLPAGHSGIRDLAVAESRAKLRRQASLGRRVTPKFARMAPSSDPSENTARCLPTPGPPRRRYRSNTSHGFSRLVAAAPQVPADAPRRRPLVHLRLLRQPQRPQARVGGRRLLLPHPQQLLDGAEPGALLRHRLGQPSAPKAMISWRRLPEAPAAAGGRSCRTP